LQSSDVTALQIRKPCGIRRAGIKEHLLVAIHVVIIIINLI